MHYSDDPARDFAAWDMEQEQGLSRLPVCDKCGDPIQDDFYWEINGEILCEGCMNTLYRNYTDDFCK